MWSSFLIEVVVLNLTRPQKTRLSYIYALNHLLLVIIWFLWNWLHKEKVCQSRPMCFGGFICRTKIMGISNFDAFIKQVERKLFFFCFFYKSLSFKINLISGWLPDVTFLSKRQMSSLKDLKSIPYSFIGNIKIFYSFYRTNNIL